MEQKTLYKNLNSAKLSLQPFIKNRAGIYQLVNLKNGDIYVGSSKNLDKRLNFYLNPNDLVKALKKGRSHIIRALLKYGSDNFGIIILEFIESNPNLSPLEQKNMLFMREQYYIYTNKPEYNIIKSLGDGLGFHYPEEIRQKMRENNAISKKIYVYNSDGSTLKLFTSMLQAGNELGINRRAISSRLKKNINKPIHLFNKEKTKSYIISLNSLTLSELNEFILSDSGKAIFSAQKTIGLNKHKKIYAYTADGKPYLSSPFDSLAQAGRELKANPATILKYARQNRPFNGLNLSLKPIQ